MFNNIIVMLFKISKHLEKKIKFIIEAGKYEMVKDGFMYLKDKGNKQSFFVFYNVDTLSAELKVQLEETGRVFTSKGKFYKFLKDIKKEIKQNNK